jgi:hypothetical protein
MGRSKKDLHYGSRDGKGGVVRMSVADRTSKAARPWNEPQVVNASSSYGVKFNSYIGMTNKQITELNPLQQTQPQRQKEIEYHSDGTMWDAQTKQYLGRYK